MEKLPAAWCQGKYQLLGVSIGIRSTDSGTDRTISWYIDRAIDRDIDRGINRTARWYTGRYSSWKFDRSIDRTNSRYIGRSVHRAGVAVG